jgi:predicted amidohydrolase
MNNHALVTVAAAQYGVEFLDSWQHYADKLAYRVEEAVAQGAQILVFPEYACLELASLFAASVYTNLHTQLEALQELLPNFLHLHRKLARQYGVYLVASSFPVQCRGAPRGGGPLGAATAPNGGAHPEGTRQHGAPLGAYYRNRAFFCMPDGACDFQDKLMMTRFENEVWNISRGYEIKVFPTAHGLVGVNICYDNEFPLIARQQVEMGAQIILSPSSTDTLAGFNRVRIGCRARAMENQCYVVMSSVVGTVDWSAAMDVHIGAAGIFTPVDTGFPGDGVLAQGEMNTPQWVIAELDLSRLHEVRTNGQVLNHRDWDRQMEFTHKTFA